MKATSLRIFERRQQRQRLMLRLDALAGARTVTGDDVAGTNLTANLPGWLRLRLVRAGIEADGRTLSIAAGVMVLLAVATGIADMPVIALLALVLPPLAALLAVEWRAARNLNAFVADLPFLLDSVLQLLRVGNSLQQALVKASESAGPAIGRFLLPSIHRIQHGVPVADSLNWAAERIALTELRMLAAGVKINGRYGGSMAAILANLAQLLRHAAGVRRDLKAATAEARFSGLVLMAMPIVITAMMAAINPAYVGFFMENAQGHRLAAIAAVLQLTGMVVMRRLMRLAF